MTKEWQVPTPGVRFTEVSVKRELTVSPSLRASSLGVFLYFFAIACSQAMYRQNVRFYSLVSVYRCHGSIDSANIYIMANFNERPLTGVNVASIQLREDYFKKS